jgi:hypothetical protein
MLRDIDDARAKILRFMSDLERRCWTNALVDGVDPDDIDAALEISRRECAQQLTEIDALFKMASTGELFVE